MQNAVRHNLTAGGRVTVNVSDEVTRAVIRVANTGPVVASSNLPTLFEPFRRATDRIDAGQGVGLGLSIVKTVAEAHHGSVHATANVEGGLIVVVELPRHHRDGATDEAIGADCGVPSEI